MKKQSPFATISHVLWAMLLITTFAFSFEMWQSLCVRESENVWINKKFNEYFKQFENQVVIKWRTIGGLVHAFSSIFWECASKNLTWSQLCECMVCAAPKHLLHTARTAEPRHIVAGVRLHGSREETRFQHERFSRARFILAVTAQAWRCMQRTEHSGGFGFQTKVKDRFLNQRRWTCWYSCRKKNASPVSKFSFWFEKLVIFAVYLTLLYGGFP